MQKENGHKNLEAENKRKWGTHKQNQTVVASQNDI